MLVLSRKPQQRIIIGQDIEIVILDIRGNRVKLGIRAPSEVSIVRDELERQDQCEDHDAQKNALILTMRESSSVASPSPPDAGEIKECDHASDS